MIKPPAPNPPKKTVIRIRRNFLDTINAKKWKKNNEEEIKSNLLEDRRSENSPMGIIRDKEAME